MISRGTLLKDNTNLYMLNIKPGQTFMVIGSATEPPNAPTEPVIFLEDLPAIQSRRLVQHHAGLSNLGNTSWLNSALQILRAIPELQVALSRFRPTLGEANEEADLTDTLRTTFDQWAFHAQQAKQYAPEILLTHLRRLVPQLAKRQRHGAFAQQDAVEAVASLLSGLTWTLGRTSSFREQGAEQSTSCQSLQQYFQGSLSGKLSTTEAPNEDPRYFSELFGILPCCITPTTHHMTQGIFHSLNSLTTMHSETLGCTAVYDESLLLDRIPTYLMISFTRFYTRQSTGAKTKNMGKVKYPLELDMTEFLSETLKTQTKAYREKFLKLSKERKQRVRARSRAKADKEKATNSGAAASDPRGHRRTQQHRRAYSTALEAMQELPAALTSLKISSAPLACVVSEEEEQRIREKEAMDLEALVHPNLKKDVGANVSGLYELRGIITHRGAYAEGGHYISWVAKDEDNQFDTSGRAKSIDAPSVQWYKVSRPRKQVLAHYTTA